MSHYYACSDGSSSNAAILSIFMKLNLMIYIQDTFGGMHTLQDHNTVPDRTDNVWFHAIS